jgi:hypothetical protein
MVDEGMKFAESRPCARGFYQIHLLMYLTVGITPMRVWLPPAEYCKILLERNFATCARGFYQSKRGEPPKATPLRFSYWIMR